METFYYFYCENDYFHSNYRISCAYYLLIKIEHLFTGCSTFFYFTRFFNTPNKIAVTAIPIAIANKYSNIFPARVEFPSKVGRINNPPCGAGEPILNKVANRPETAYPATAEGITLAGSEAAKGMAPSVMKEAPIILFVSPASRSSFVNFFLNTEVASAIPSGGTMPPANIAACGVNNPSAIMANPNV